MHVALTTVLAILTVAFGGYSVYRLWDDQRPKISFRMILIEQYPAVKIFNLGKTPVLLEAAEFVDCRSGDGTSCAIGRQMNPACEPFQWGMPVQIVDAIPLAADFEVRIRYKTPNEKTFLTAPLSFSLVGSRRIFKLREGFHHVRDASCPICGDAFLMDATGLDNEKRVADRRREFESAIAEKCPEHDPVLVLRQQRKDLEASGITSDIGL
jgi:hypothetical protein